MKTCGNCLHFIPDTGEIYISRVGEECYSMCGVVLEYANEFDEACDSFESDAEVLVGM